MVQADIASAASVQALQQTEAAERRATEAQQRAAALEAEVVELRKGRDQKGIAQKGKGTSAELRAAEAERKVAALEAQVAELQKESAAAADPYVAIHVWPNFVAAQQGKADLEKAREAAAREAEAATRVQAISRGRSSRKSSVATGGGARPTAASSSSPSSSAKAPPAEAQAATRVQAIQRGKQTRKVYVKKAEEKAATSAAATRVQAVQRGKRERAKTPEERKAAAAATIQKLEEQKEIEQRKALKNVVATVTIDPHIVDGEVDADVLIDISGLNL